MSIRPSLQGFHHVAIIASDYERAKAFYVDILGFEVMAENYRSDRDSYKLDLRLQDGSQIELFSFPTAPPRPTQPEAQGLRHLAFRVSSVQAFCDYLASQHVPSEPIRVDQYTGKRFTFFQDPDGLPLEIYEH